jgi:SecD/SecF fusion protein
MRNLPLKLGLVVIILLLAGLAIYPPSQSLKLGKDLRGGTSLVYSVQIDPGQNAERVINQVIDVLKNRIDPNGTKDITFTPQGRDRIEISFPQSDAETQRLRAAFEEELGKLQVTVVTASEFERVMRLAGDELEQAIDAIAGGDEARADQLREAAEALAQSTAKRAELQPLLQQLDEATEALEAEQAVAPVEGQGPPPNLERIDELQAQVDDLQSQVDALVSEIAQLELAYDGARSAVLDRAVRPEAVRIALERSNRPIVMIDDQTNDRVELPSPRRQALDRIIDEHPELEQQIRDIEAAYDAYTAKATGFEDPADMVRLLKGSGVLDFRITVDPGSHPDEQRLRDELRERGPRNVQSIDTDWLKIDKIESFAQSVQDLKNAVAFPAQFFQTRNFVVEPYEGEWYMLIWDVRGSRLLGSSGDWSVARALQGQDDVGRPAINFEMDARGAVKLGELTQAHRGDRMAVILDDRVITAPTINAQITRSGIIEGQFTPDEIRTIIRVMQAGSLAARLSPEPISITTLGPNLGADNLRSGLNAGMWALVVVSLFMIFYYYLCGIVACIALACNGLLILGAMALSMQAFTLPGIAGVILTFGMAVDANVLIFERIREELRAGEELRAAVRLGFSKALSSIVDGNVTNLIVCIVLYQVGTPEIKGFALTLGIGVVTTMLSALVISRILFTVLTEWFGLRRVSMLPMTFPAIERALEPKINWMRLRWIFVFISSCYVGLGLLMVAKQGSAMLDLEFRGGTMVELDFVDPATGQPYPMQRADVAAEVVAIGDEAGPESVLYGLSRQPVVLPIDPQSDGVTSDRFIIKTLVTDQDAVQDAIVNRFRAHLQGFGPLTFTAMDVERARDAPVDPIITGRLRDDLNRGSYRGDAGAYIGGVVILVEQLNPPPTLSSLHDRLELMRRQQDFSSTLIRNRDIVILEGDETAVRSAAIVVADPSLSYFDDEQAWWEDLASIEWRLVQDALTRASTPGQVQGFSPAIAQTFRAQAIIAVLLSFLLIVIYIWVRFGSVRYSLAAIIALMHDVLTVIGLIALAEIVYDFDATSTIARHLNIMPFKIDLSLVAAILTIVGYSLNDSIIIMDRIRENRGKLDYASKRVVNLSINQTISRTIITSGTTLLAVLILYIFGGEGVRAFSFALLIGVMVGTYSSIAVAAPLVWSRKADRQADKEDADA